MRVRQNIRRRVPNSAVAETITPIRTSASQVPFTPSGGGLLVLLVLLVLLAARCKTIWRACVASYCGARSQVRATAPRCLTLS